MSAVNKAKQQGRANAFRQGRMEGYRYGGCRAVMERVQPAGPVKSALRILYVPQGFDSIDQGLITALKEASAELSVAGPAEMVETARNWKPDLVLVLNALHVFPPEHASDIDLLRSWGIRTAIWFVDDPYFTEYTQVLAQHFDDVFTHELSCVPFYEAAGCRTHYLPLGADFGLFGPEEAPRAYQSDICFIGNAFWNRVALFDELAPYLSSRRVIIVGSYWDRLSSYNLLQPFIRDGWVPPAETRLYYNGAKIVINLHRPSEPGLDNHNAAGLPGCSINPRTYEISACGTLQLTDIRQDLTAHYRPGYDIETYGSAAELKDKIEYYLHHEEERLQVAWRSLWTTRQRHTYTERIGRLLAAVQ
jgi:spore maturation protein CgeB